jgi:thiamine biosynthesis lipoprotein
MGTFATVRVPASDRSGLEALTGTAKGIFEGIDLALSTYKPDSEISRLNRAAGDGPVQVSPRTLQILRTSARYGELTGGAFEPTLGPLIRKWGFSGGKAPSRPLDAEEVKAELERVGMRHLKVEGATAFLELPGMSIDLGGIAKGFAVDLACDEILRRGARSFIVDLGGNLRCSGGNGGRPWRVGVRNPFRQASADGGLVGVLRLGDGAAVATSGNYEQFIEIGGERYTHIIDPRTGRPTKGMAGVTVVSPTATEADALSTALFVLGPDEGRKVLARCPGSAAIWIPDKQPVELLVAPGLETVFEPFPEFAASVRRLER